MNRFVQPVFWSGMAALAFGLLLAAARASAADRPAVLTGYTTQSWDIENGLPQNSVQALAQTRDGFLWIGTESGLARFDGVSFQIFDRNSNPSLPGNDIRSLLETHDGAFWIGTSSGLARWKDGAATTYTTHDGLPANGIRKLLETSDGVLWAWTDLGLARFSGAGFLPAIDGADGSTITAVLPGERGSLLVEWPQRSTVYLNGQWSNTAPSAEMSNAAVALSAQVPGSRVQASIADQAGRTWIGANQGLVRWDGKQLQKFPSSNPLSSASILSLLEDREGNLWVGTENAGLHVLRAQRFRTWGVQDGLSSNQITTVVEDSAGAIWAGTTRDGLDALRPGERDASAPRGLSVKDGLASNVILALAAVPSGDVWVGTPDGLSRIRNNRIATFTSADGLPDDFIRSVFVDSDGSLWIGTRRGLTHWNNAGDAASPSLRTYTHANGLGSDLVGAIARDTKGNLWIATLGGLSRMKDGIISTFTVANGLSGSIVTSLLPQPDGTLLIGTENHGWDAWNPNRSGSSFIPIAANGLDQATIHGILSDEAGNLWFATSNGIARCDRSAGSQPNSQPGCSRLISFGAADGVPAREATRSSHPSAWRSRDGHLWFATAEGLVEVDPAHFPINTVPPPIAIERFSADGTEQPASPSSIIKIAAGRSHFEFDYAALSFVAPHKVLYRYMLEGFDNGWTDAGTRRSAYYTNIPPGHYTFRVQAQNNDGLWNTTGAALSFDLQRHFYQTLWFYALLVVTAAGLIFALIRTRMGRANREFSAVLAERSRIAREIHDTLAQGYVGVSVQLEVLGELLRRRKVDDAEKQLERTRDFVREGLADARQSIWALRTPDSSETNLPVRIRRAVEAAEGPGLESQFTIYGAYRPLPASTEGEMLRIAQEAIHNAKKHAGASRLSVRLEYKGDEVTVEVCDNGKGGAGNAAPGRFGLTGMRERAAAIGATLELRSESGMGTEVRLRAPAAREQGRGTQ